MKWLHNLLKGASLTTALFVFQACYGMPQDLKRDMVDEAPMSFTIVSALDGSPIQGIRISGRSSSSDHASSYLGTSNENGSCRVYLPYRQDVDGPIVAFDDPQGRYQVKDTSLVDLRERDIRIVLTPQP